MNRDFGVIYEAIINTSRRQIADMEIKNEMDQVPVHILMIKISFFVANRIFEIFSLMWVIFFHFLTVIRMNYII